MNSIDLLRIEEIVPYFAKNTHNLFYENDLRKNILFENHAVIYLNGKSGC